MGDDLAHQKTITSKLTCGICEEALLEEEEGWKFLRLHCGHTACMDCLQHYAHTSIKQTQMMTCTCGENVTAQEVGAILGKEHEDKYTQIELIYLRRLMGLYHCPTADCPNSVFTDGNADNMQVFACEVCGKTYCITCNREKHNGCQCGTPAVTHHMENNNHNGADNQAQPVKTTRTPFTKEEEKLFRKFVKQGLMKQCKCGNFIEKNGGCMYIKCPMCHLGFCWECNAILGGREPNCKHTRGHTWNHTQWMERAPVLEETQTVIGDKDYVATIEKEEKEKEQGKGSKKKRSSCVIS